MIELPPDMADNLRLIITKGYGSLTQYTTSKALLDEDLYLSIKQCLFSHALVKAFYVDGLLVRAGSKLVIPHELLLMAAIQRIEAKMPIHEWLRRNNIDFLVWWQYVYKNLDMEIITRRLIDSGYYKNAPARVTEEICGKRTKTALFHRYRNHGNMAHVFNELAKIRARYINSLDLDLLRSQALDKYITITATAEAAGVTRSTVNNFFTHARYSPKMLYLLVNDKILTREGMPATIQKVLDNFDDPKVKQKQALLYKRERYPSRQKKRAA